MISIKANCIDSTAPPEAVFDREVVGPAMSNSTLPGMSHGSSISSSTAFEQADNMTM